MADANARLQFLWKASHMLLVPCPQVSSLYMSQFLSLASERDLRLHEEIQSRACAACGSIFVPGVNSTTKIVATETRQEKESRKSKERKKSKTEKNKTNTPNKQVNGRDQGLRIVVDKASCDMPMVDNINTGTSTMSASYLQRTTINSRKKIRIIPYTEQMQKQYLVQRGLGSKRLDKAEVRSNQLLNNIVYHCKQCERQTVIPGSKKEYLVNRIKPTKTISRTRKQKQVRPQHPTSTSAQSSSLPSRDRNASLTAIAGQKRSRPGVSASMPASPVGGLSRASSTMSSAATSPESSPRISGLHEKSNSKKKKKTNLASLLASQKAEKESSSDQGGGDSVLANFLMGL